MDTLGLRVPDIGVEGEVEVIELCVGVGDRVDIDDPIVVLESDKATVEVPATAAGVVASLAVAVGDKVRYDDELLSLSPAGGGEPPRQNAAPEEQQSPAVAQTEAIDRAPIAETMAVSEILVPELGGAETAEVIEVLINQADQIEVDQTIIVLESDKATMEIPSPAAGQLTEVMVNVGDAVSAGQLIAKIRSEVNDGVAVAPEADDVNSSTAAPISPNDSSLATKKAPASTLDTLGENTRVSTVHAGPAVRKQARELGVILEHVTGSGPKQRITKDDLIAYVKHQLGSAQHGAGVHGAIPATPLPDFSSFGEVDTVSMDRVQKVTAANMHASWHQVPHVTQFDLADITELETFRKQHKQSGLDKGISLTLLAFLLKASAYALEKLPQFNVSIDIPNGKIFQKKYIHIGVAVATDHGLMVPVVKDVNAKTLWQLAQECQLLAAKARDRKLLPADMQGGCFTISSLGGIGGTAFTPIVNAPEVAILGVSKSSFQPVYNGSEFEPRLMLPLSLSYDHRAINGADAAMFTQCLTKVLGDLRELLL